MAVVSCHTARGEGRSNNTTKKKIRGRQKCVSKSRHHITAGGHHGKVVHTLVVVVKGVGHNNTAAHTWVVLVSPLLCFFFLPGHCGRHRWQRERERWGSGSSAVVHHMSCTKAFCWVCFRLTSTASSPQARKGQPAFCACSASSLEARRTRPWCTRTPPQSLHPSGRTRASWGRRPPAEEQTSAP